MWASFPFVFEGGMWDLNALDPDYCLSFYFAQEHIKARLLGNASHPKSKSNKMQQNTSRNENHTSERRQHVL